MLTPLASPPQEQVSVLAPFDSAGGEQLDFIKFSQELLEIARSNASQSENLSSQLKKTNAELETLKRHITTQYGESNLHQEKIPGEIQGLKTLLTALQEENKYISQRCESNEELCSLLDEAQQKQHIALEKLRLAIEKLQDMVQPQPSAPEKVVPSNSHVSQMKKRFSGETLPQQPSIPRNPETEKDLICLREANLLGDPDKVNKSADVNKHPELQQLPLLQSKIESLQKQVTQITNKMSESQKKTETENQESKNLDVPKIILEKLDYLDLTGLPRRVMSLENKNCTEEIAHLRRTVFFQWIGSGVMFSYVVAFSLWMYTHRK